MIQFDPEVLAEALAHALLRRDGALKKLAFHVAQYLLREHTDTIRAAVAEAIVGNVPRVVREALTPLATAEIRRVVSSPAIDAMVRAELVKRIAAMSSEDLARMVRK